MRITTNISALMSYNSLASVSGKLEKSIARLTTGLRINTAADDAAGLAVAEKMRAQARGLDQAYQNAQDGISLLQTAEGALGEVHNILQRMRELSVQAANDTLTAADRQHVQLEIDQLTEQINNISTQTQFNKKKLLDGSAAVLWSTSTSDIGVIVSGTLRSKDAFGTVQSAAGNYKITFNTSKTGTENIQKSNILTLKHGTASSQLSVKYEKDDATGEMKNVSGLENLTATNLVEGNWRLETRETPFGGVKFYNGVDAQGEPNQVDPAVIGLVEVTATSTPNVVAPGEYDIRVSDTVPMMAEFADALADDVVRGINVSSRNTFADDFDVQFTTAVAAGALSQTRIYDGHDNITGGIAVDNGGQNVTTGATTGMHINTNTNSDLNVFTHYSVNTTDLRDISGGVITIKEDYVTASDAAISLDLNYRSRVGATASATYTYHASEAGQYSFTLGAFQVDTDHTFSATVTNVDDLGNLTTDTVVADIAKGDSINEIVTKINAAFNAKRNTDVIATMSLGGELIISNLPDDPLLGGTSSVKIDKTDFSEYLGLSDKVVGNGLSATATKAMATGNDPVTVDIAAGDTVDTIRTKLNTALSGQGFTVTMATDSATHLTTISLAQTAGQIGHRGLTTNTGTGSAQEIAFTGSLAYDATGPISTAGKYNNYTHTGIDTGNMNLENIRSAIETALRNDITSAGGAGADVEMQITNSGTIGLDRLTLKNNATSQYTITITSTDNGNFMNTATVGRDQEHDFGKVWNNAHLVVNVANMTMAEIRTSLANEYNRTNPLDDINTGRNGNTVFTLDTTSTPGQAKITLRNFDDTAYDIGVSDVTGRSTATLTEMWTGGKTTNRGNGNTAESSSMMLGNTIQTIAAGLTMEQLKDEITNDTNTKLLANWSNAANTPGYDGSHHTGQLTLANQSNNTTGADRRAYIISQVGIENGLGAANAQRQLFATERRIEQNTSNTNSQVWQARDAVSFSVKYEGNDTNGELLNGTFTIGTGGSAMNAAGADTGNWIWEGDQGSENAIHANASAGGRFSNFYTNFYIDDTVPTAADTSGTALLYTQAQVTGDATNLTVNLGDGKTTSNNDEAVTYSFNAGALAEKDIKLGQMLWLGNGNNDVERLIHDIEFGNNADTTGITFSYAQRKNAGDVNAWGLDNPDGIPAWYSHAYYGKDTTYYYHSEAIDPTKVVEDAIVNRQNSYSASLLFIYDGSGFTVKAKAVGDNGTAKDETTTDNVKANGHVAIDIGGGDIIEFTNLKINTNGLTAGDKFVINVAAAAKTMKDDLNLTGAADQFVSYANIAVTGDPFQQSGAAGSTAQYRLQNDAEDGKEIAMLGYFVDPINGANQIPGVGYYTGTLNLKADTAGFNGGTVGVPGDETDNTAHRVHIEVNYQGSTAYSAGALVTSAYFTRMTQDDSLVLADMVSGIGYSNYEYEIRDGKLRQMDVEDKEVYNKLNGSLIFDVIKIEGQVLTFRVQGHMIDRNGREFYAEEEFSLLAGANTERDSMRQLSPDEVNQPVWLFKDTDFGNKGLKGIFFDEMTLGSADKWDVGDRFSVTLTASGFTDGYSEEKQMQAKEGDADFSAVDEINLFSDNRGSTMPHSFRFNEGVLDNKKTDLRIYQVAHNLVRPDGAHFASDQVMDGTLSLSFGEFMPGTETGKERNAATFLTTFERGQDFGVAHYYSNVEDIAQFWDANGRFILEGSDRMLTIRQDGRETRVQLSETWEVGEMASAISSAMWNDLLKQHQEGPKGKDDPLDMEADKEYMMDKADKNKIFQFVNTVPGSSSIDSVTGTLLAHSVLGGSDKALEFYGDDDVLNAFAFNTIQQATDTEFRADVTDAHSGKSVTSNAKVVAGKTCTGLITDGVSLTIDGDIGVQSAKYNDDKGMFEIGMKDQFSHVVHLVDNAATLQIGANEGEDMYLTLGDVSAAALGIDKLSVRSRESAARSITLLDNAITRVSSQRAMIGSQINRLEHTMANLSVSSINLKNSMSRIEDADIAKEMMSYAKFGVLQQAGMTLLSQANQSASNILALIR